MHQGPAHGCSRPAGAALWDGKAATAGEVAAADKAMPLSLHCPSTGIRPGLELYPLHLESSTMLEARDTGAMQA